MHVLPGIGGREGDGPCLPGHIDRTVDVCASYFEAVPVSNRDPRSVTRSRSLRRVVTTSATYAFPPPSIPTGVPPIVSCSRRCFWMSVLTAPTLSFVAAVMSTRRSSPSAWCPMPTACRMASSTLDAG